MSSAITYKRYLNLLSSLKVLSLVCTALHQWVSTTSSCPVVHCDVTQQDNTWPHPFRLTTAFLRQQIKASSLFNDRRFQPGIRMADRRNIYRKSEYNTIRRDTVRLMQQAEDITRTDLRIFISNNWCGSLCCNTLYNQVFKFKHQGPVFQNGVRQGVNLNLTKSATKPKIAFFKTA